MRVIFPHDYTADPGAQEVLTGLQDLGCTYEGLKPKMVSANVPPAVKVGSKVTIQYSMTAETVTAKDAKTSTKSN